MGGAGARIYAELSGYNATTDGLHETRPDPKGAAARAIGRALEKAGAVPREVSAVFAHAAGTQVGDTAEVRALAAGAGRVASGSLGHSHKIAPGAGAPPFAPPD